MGNFGLEKPPKPASLGLTGPEYAVSARPADPERSFARGHFVRVLPDGSFHQRLPPGTYDLAAYPAGRGVSLLSNPLTAAELDKLSRRVEVKAGETVQVTLPAAREP